MIFPLKFENQEASSVSKVKDAEKTSNTGGQAAQRFKKKLKNPSEMGLIEDEY